MDVAGSAVVLAVAAVEGDDEEVGVPAHLILLTLILIVLRRSLILADDASFLGLVSSM